MSRYSGIAIGSVSFCPKLLGECNFESPVLCQATGELQFAGSCFVSSYCGVTNCRVLRCAKPSGEFQHCRVLFDPKLLGECNFEAPALSSYCVITNCMFLRCVKLL